MFGGVYEGLWWLSSATLGVTKLLEMRVADIEVVEALSNLWQQE
jgi:hypothetical protein